ncbi:MAG: NAD(P)H-dependent oxidoreductase [Chloroflexi bacterium]|nr:NAD(P)H-dependent oxidoreductase [Chloroflexota bacterium]
MTTQQRPIKVLGISGSLRAGSTSLAALKVALEAAGALGARTEVLELQHLDLPMYVPGKPLEGYPDSVRLLLRKVREADAMIWAGPAYHGTISGAFKNALDFLEFLDTERPLYLTDKVVGMIATSGGVPASVNTINAMTHVAQTLRAWTATIQVPIGPTRDLFRDGELRDEPTAERLRMLGRQVVRFVQSRAAGRR